MIFTYEVWLNFLSFVQVCWLPSWRLSILTIRPSAEKWRPPKPEKVRERGLEMDSSVKILDRFYNLDYERNSIKENIGIYSDPSMSLIDNKSLLTFNLKIEFYIFGFFYK